MRIRDLFQERIESPDDERLMKGLEENVIYEHISVTYLNGFINYCNILRGYMIQVYSDDDQWEVMCKNIDNLPVTFHTNISDSENFDYVVILAETENYWYFFDNDCDGSCCSIGMLSKDKYRCKNYLLGCLKEEAENISEYFENSSKSKLKELTSAHFSGWITL